MNKNEILEKSRMDNEKCDEREYIIKLKAHRLASSTALLFGIIMAVLELIFADYLIVSFSVFSVIYLMFTIDSCIIYYNIKAKKNLIQCIIEAVIFIVCFALLLTYIF